MPDIVPDTTSEPDKQLSPVTESGDNDFAKMVMGHVLKILELTYTNENIRAEQIKMAQSAMKGMKPEDEIEAMLIAQIIGMHSVTMLHLRNAMIPGQSTDTDMRYATMLNKLSRTFVALTEGLACHRGKGTSEQKIIVQHQHIDVHEGAQAIIGNVTRSQGGGITKNGNHPHAKE